MARTIKLFHAARNARGQSRDRGETRRNLVRQPAGGGFDMHAAIHYRHGRRFAAHPADIPLFLERLRRLHIVSGWRKVRVYSFGCGGSRRACQWMMAKLSGVHITTSALHSKLTGGFSSRFAVWRVHRFIRRWPRARASICEVPIRVTLDLLWNEYKASTPTVTRTPGFARYSEWRIRSANLAANTCSGEKLFVDYSAQGCDHQCGNG